MRSRGLALCIVVASAGAAHAQAVDPLSAAAKHTYEIVTGYITKAAAQVPEELYSFQPTPDVRTLGQLFAHVADANFALCSVVAQEKAPAGGIEKTKTSKADLTKALADSFAYCKAVHDKMTDATGSAIVKFMAAGRRPEAMPKISVLEYNTHHTFEHYGNIVTYHASQRAGSAFVAIARRRALRLAGDDATVVVNGRSLHDCA